MSYPSSSSGEFPISILQECQSYYKFHNYQAIEENVSRKLRPPRLKNTMNKRENVDRVRLWLVDEIYVIFIVSSKSLHVPNFTCRISHASQSKSVHLQIYVYMFIIAKMPLIRGW